jgi:hypothetical protein
MPLARAVLWIQFNGEIINWKLIFGIFIEISSYLYEYFVLRGLIMLPLSVVVVGLYFICVHIMY